METRNQSGRGIEKTIIGCCGAGFVECSGIFKKGKPKGKYKYV